MYDYATNRELGPFSLGPIVRRTLHGTQNHPENHRSSKKCQRYGSHVRPDGERILVANLLFVVADEQPSEREVAAYEGRDR